VSRSPKGQAQGARASRSPKGQAQGARASRSQDAAETAALQKEEHRGWYSRGYLPHFDQPQLIQFVTFRLADSLPKEVAQAIEHELRKKKTPKSTWEAERRERLEAYLDAGHGACHLRVPRIAELVQNALLHFDGQRYRLIEWAIMPNHVHVLIEQMEGHRLGAVLHAWKSFTSKEANKLLRRTGAFWEADFFDRYIRNEKHYERVAAYIRENPVMAGLSKRPEDWAWSSAARRTHSA
jgi:REP element-mobilizing transposase RayT